MNFPTILDLALYLKGQSAAHQLNSQYKSLKPSFTLRHSWINVHITRHHCCSKLNIYMLLHFSSSLTLQCYMYYTYVSVASINNYLTCLRQSVSLNSTCWLATDLIFSHTFNLNPCAYIRLLPLSFCSWQIMFSCFDIICFFTNRFVWHLQSWFEYSFYLVPKSAVYNKLK